MTDPVSIISTAVGITSLGAQLCQAVVNYYTQYKCFDNDIDGVIKRAEVLELTLEALESVRQKDASKNNTASKQLKLAIEACAGSLMALKIMTIKLGEFRRPTSIEDRRRLLKKKLLWPFKQVTLLKLGETLNEVQSNVQLAIQVMEMDTGHDRFEAIQSDTRVVFHCGNRIEHHLDKHTHQLDAIQKYSRNSLDFENQAMSKLTKLTLQLASIEKRWTQPNSSTSNDPMLKEQARIVNFGELSAGNEIHNSLHSGKSDGSSDTPRQNTGQIVRIFNMEEHHTTSKADSPLLQNFSDSTWN
ncbi:hypothetical protein BS50DRAFT_680177 [Corynespora cassiicola Philippines]|uniref:Fungal N-terminal domain-containing protein n=1 Tax=Corynespora cassiicola Philippines TaxID=1448308 RepID=A0A2T2NC72_CORCC|nr:hypothetical protein BS50DRAFT_680177 [Corynespora cassiicola Philippines]